MTTWLNQFGPFFFHSPWKINDCILLTSLSSARDIFKIMQMLKWKSSSLLHEYDHSYLWTHFPFKRIDHWNWLLTILEFPVFRSLGLIIDCRTAGMFCVPIIGLITDSIRMLYHLQCSDHLDWLLTRIRMLYYPQCSDHWDWLPTRFECCTLFSVPITAMDYWLD